MTYIQRWPSRPAGFVLLTQLVCAVLLTMLPFERAQAQTYTALYSFTSSGNVGYDPASGLVMDQQGRLYGTNDSGGEHGWGTVYRLSRAGSGWVATGLYSFQGGTDGGNPVANVTFGPDGTLYGTTTAGGNGFGTVFNLRPPASVCKTALCPWTETVLYRFTGGSDGGFGIDPSYADALVFDQAGNLYGTTPDGGTHRSGVVFKLTRAGSGWTESVLWNFTSGTDGCFPASGVVFDSAGNLFGTAPCGGTHDDGVAYELSPSGTGWTQQTLYSFTNQDQGPPDGGLAMDAQGNLYGTTGGNTGEAEAYELTLSGENWTVSRRQVFSVYEGAYDTPTLDAQGNLYGTILGGGGGLGEVFKLAPSGNGWIYTELYDFNNFNDGLEPISGVTLDGSGNLYGTTFVGGESGLGVAWEITP